MTPRSETPEAEHRRLRVALRHARDALNLTQKEVAEALDWSTSKLIRIEKGAVGVSVTDLKALLLHYRVTEADEVDRMVSMVRASKKSAWWQEYRDLYPQDYITYLSLESSAIRIRQFQGLVVPGLLQSPGYIQQLMTLGNPGEEVVQRAFNIRVRRQTLLSDNGPELFFILDESTLYRQVGDTAVMREQLTKLRDVARSRRASIRIMPYSAGVHRGMKGSFAILEMSADPDDYTLLLEQPYKDHLIETASDETHEFVEIFHELEKIALSTSESRRRIDDRLKELEKDG
jgi:transcriptional regulator with XRE-family HTH domain